MSGKSTVKSIVRSASLAMLLGTVSASAFTGAMLAGVSAAQAAVVSNIDVRGNTRMDDTTIKSFIKIKPGKSFGNGEINESVKALFETGLFSDVSIYQSGSTLIVEVDENSVVNQVFFEGNSRLKDQALSSIVQAKGRGIYSPSLVESDVERIRQAYRQVGRSDATVTSEIVPLANNRVNIVYRVNEGDKTKINSISFAGNSAFRENRLLAVISTKPTNLFSWLRNDDIYDPARFAADQEKLHQFYYNNGYADFQIVSTSVDLDESANAYNITITVDEGRKYTFGNVSIESTLSGVDANSLYGELEIASGDTYSARDVENSIVNLTESIASSGYPFVEVVPRGDRNFENGTIDVTFLVDQGARVYVEEIVILGNDRTRDHVIRREFEMSEGDAFNQVLIKKTKSRLENLGFFDSVDITTRAGSAPDRVVVVVRVADKPTGEFSIGGGYSSTGGASGEISFTEKNFLGRGQYLRVAGKFGENDTNYSLSFTEPYFLGYRMSAGFDLERNVSEADTYRRYASRTTSALLRLGVPITDDLSVSPFYTYSRNETQIDGSNIDIGPDGNPSTADGPNPPLVAPYNGLQGDRKGELSRALYRNNEEWTKSGFGYTVLYNTVDNRVTPREGTYLRFTQTLFGAGGDAGYLQTDGEVQNYTLLSEDFDVVGMLRARGGMINPFNNGKNYRALDNYFSSSREVRGFESNGFGPRDPITGDALGGLYHWNATAEVNFPMPFLPDNMGVRGAVFADVGQVWGMDGTTKSLYAGVVPVSVRGDLNDDAVRASVGASIIWASPFGPLRFDYAVPVMQEKYDRVREFTFGVSTAF